MTLGVMSLHRFSSFASLENFRSRFLRNYESQSINMDNDWMYSVYQKRGQGSITLGVMSLCRFSITCLYSYFNETYTTLGL